MAYPAGTKTDVTLALARDNGVRVDER